jgi:hypothetical protein
MFIPRFHLILILELHLVKPALPPPPPNNEVLVKVNDVASDALLPESTNMDVNNDAPPPQHMEKRNYFSIYL